MKILNHVFFTGFYLTTGLVAWCYLLLQVIQLVKNDAHVDINRLLLTFACLCGADMMFFKRVELWKEAAEKEKAEDEKKRWL